MQRAKLKGEFKRVSNPGRRGNTPPPVLQKRAVGRPSDYRDGYAQMAYKLRLGGFSIERIADIFETNTHTLYRWADRVPEFREALIKGGEIADAEIAHALYHRAKGYSHRAEKIHFDKFGDVHRAAYTEHYPPDTRAAELWLANRQKSLWRSTSRVEITDGDGKPVTPPAIQINVVAAAQAKANSND